MARRKKRKFKMPSTEFFLKLAGSAALLLGGYWLLDDYYEEEAEMRRVEREQDRAREEAQRRADSLADEQRRVEDSLRAHHVYSITLKDVQDMIRSQGERNAAAPALMEKLRQGGELTPDEENIVYDYYRDEYYEDPEDENRYPTEIFEAREDYDEGHVMDNPATAGED